MKLPLKQEHNPEPLMVARMMIGTLSQPQNVTRGAPDEDDEDEDEAALTLLGDGLLALDGDTLLAETLLEDDDDWQGAVLRLITPCHSPQMPWMLK
jgi:hypothetical protein